jgi:predicted AAA+ superfamily ATPase
LSEKQNEVKTMFERKILAKIKKHLGSDQVTVITGARQTGKTTILEQLNSFLKDKGEKVFSLTLEDPAMLNALNENPENIFKYISSYKKRIFLLLDEVQYLAEPSGFLKLIYDKYRKQIKIIATGSSAFYIDRKFSDSLAGRKRIFELYPLDFEEFLVFRRHDDLITEWHEIRKRSNYVSTHRILIQSLFDEYLTFGGYPAVVTEDDPEEKKTILKELFFSYLKRDVLEAGIQNQDKFYVLMTLLAHQCGSLLNINELANTLRISVTAVENYIYILRKCFHINLVRPFYTNIRKELTRMPKTYFNDTGYRNVIINQFSPVSQRIDRGELAENYVYIRLRQLNEADRIKYWRTADGNEVDFVIPENTDKGSAIEVKFDQSEFRLSKYKKFTALYPGFELKCRAYLSEGNSDNIIGL